MVIEYVVYTVLTFSIGLLATIFGTELGAVSSGLTTEELGSGPSPLWGPLQKSKYGENIQLFSSDFLPVRPIPAVIFTGLTEVLVLMLVARRTLSLSVVSIILTIVGLALGVTIVTAVSSFFISKLILNNAPMYARDREHERREKRMRGKPTVKIYKCGICGESEASGQYVISSSSCAPAIVLCRKHSRYDLDLLADAFECPHCGYRFDPENNPTYFQEHKCANCNRELEYIKA